jgi:hypothetical protein
MATKIRTTVMSAKLDAVKQNSRVAHFSNDKCTNLT